MQLDPNFLTFLVSILTCSNIITLVFYRQEKRKKNAEAEKMEVDTDTVQISNLLRIIEENRKGRELLNKQVQELQKKQWEEYEAFNKRYSDLERQYFELKKQYQDLHKKYNDHERKYTEVQR